MRSHPAKCPKTGKCVASLSQCVDIPANGCPANLAHKCWDGACVMNATGCTAVTGCPVTAPIRCGDGSCTNQASTCNNVTSCADVGTGQTPFRCANGACVESSASCKAKNGCPITAPNRCFNGTCVNDLKECPSTVVCDGDFPVLCADGKCVGDARHCPAVHPCPSGQKLCNDLKCGTEEQCAGRIKHCPAVSLRYPLTSLIASFPYSHHDLFAHPVPPVVSLPSSQHQLDAHPESVPNRLQTVRPSLPSARLRNPTCAIPANAWQRAPIAPRMAVEQLRDRRRQTRKEHRPTRARALLNSQYCAVMGSVVPSRLTACARSLLRSCAAMVDVPAAPPSAA